MSIRRFSKSTALALLILAKMLVMALWFSASAVLTEMTAEIP